MADHLGSDHGCRGGRRERCDPLPWPAAAGHRHRLGRPDLHILIDGALGPTRAPQGSGSPIVAKAAGVAEAIVSFWTGLTHHPSSNSPWQGSPGLDPGAGHGERFGIPSAHCAGAARLDAARNRPGQQFAGKAALAKGAPTDEVMIVRKAALHRVVATEKSINLLSSLGVGAHGKRM